MIRVAFTLMSGRNWTGTGLYNYFVNLAHVLAEHARDRVQPVVFVGTDAIAANVAPFAAIPGVQIVRAAEFDESRKGGRIARRRYSPVVTVKRLTPFATTELMWRSSARNFTGGGFRFPP